jgi:hypothetical protein
MNRILTALLLGALSVGWCSTAWAQAGAAGPALRSGATEIQLNGRVQTQFNTSSAEGVPTTEWLVRRARLDVRVAVNELVSGRVQADFAGAQATLVDAFMRLRFDPGLELVAGRAFRPFGRIEQTSSARILPIERGLQIRGLDRSVDQYRVASSLGYSGRDVGLQVAGAPAGAPLGLTYAAGVFRGPAAAAAGSEDTRQFAARFTVAPVGQLRLGAGWSARDFVAPAGGAAAPRAGRAFELDAEYGAEAAGPRVIAELSTGDLDPFAGSSFRGAQLWLGYRFLAEGGRLTGIEPMLRVSHSRVPEARGGTLLTPGLNLYVGGWNRVMFNYDVWQAADGATDGSFKASFQLVF